MTDDEKQELQEERHDWSNLMQTPGWKRLEQIAKEQIEARQTQRLQLRVNSTERMAEHEFLAGEELGIALLSHLPKTIFDELSRELGLGDPDE